MNQQIWHWIHNNNQNWPVVWFLDGWAEALRTVQPLILWQAVKRKHQYLTLKGLNYGMSNKLIIGAHFSKWGRDSKHLKSPLG